MSNDLVKKGYNEVAERYSLQRDQFKNNTHLDRCIKLLKPGASILDIGCGAGIPIDTYFIERGFRVQGIDISEKQIELAKRNLPEGKFEVKDMEELRAGDYRVDAVVSFYTIFHISREKHAQLFKKINSFLPTGGLLLVTMGSSHWEGSEAFHGTTMWWSHYDAKRNRKIVEEAGFNILTDEIDDSGGEKHQVLMAEKTGENTSR